MVEQQQNKPEQKRDTVRCRMLVNMVVDREFREINGVREVVSEMEAHPGDVIDLPRAEAERLAGRQFLGYPTNRNGEGNSQLQCGQYPVMAGGKPVPIRDPQVEILHGS
jgi:hypothetical protein